MDFHHDSLPSSTFPGSPPGGQVEREAHAKTRTGPEGQLAHPADLPVVMYAGLECLLRDKVILHPLLLMALPGSGGIF